MWKRMSTSTELQGIVFHRLQCNTNLLAETAELINEEWPKSMEHRLSSLCASHDPKNALPCSLIMTGGCSSKVIAHAQLLAVVGRPQSVYLHDVIVSPNFRGCGLGRRIMEEAESYAHSHGYTSLHLFTLNKEDFYSHLGYKKGEVITPQRKCTANLDLQQAATLLGTVEVAGDSIHADEKVLHVQEPELSTNSTCTETNYSSSCSVPQLPSVPPPPPPPPPPPAVKLMPQATVRGVWMVKSYN